MPPTPKKNQRTSCSDVVKTLVKLPLRAIHGIVKALCYRHPRTNKISRNLKVQLQNQEKLEPMASEMEFFNAFERQYGIHHPFFYACPLTEALRIANNESKFLFLYLHLPDQSPLNDLFCKRTLCSELVVQFLDANFVSWGAFANKGEGSDLVASLKVSSFPFCAVVAPASSDSIMVLQQVEGPVSAEALMEILHRTLDEQGSAFNAMRSEEEKTRRENQQLRQEQDAAYLESLRKDKEKELQQKRASGKGPGAATKGPSPMGHIAKETTKNPQTNGTNGSKRPNQITKMMIRLPNGERVRCSLHPTDTVRSIFNYIDSLDIRGMGSYQILTNFPKRVYGYEQLGMTLRDAGFHPSATLFVEQLP
ncbi:FAS-associated factor 2-B-like protein [Carex littledalei]|uniref:FAS-associated factor 2-B-like protein n=1 Tax=Carex littledalei TaxID=544730 RepID=A0A833R2M6_9POAL|nr:FAS-associated factor 2-B-like protein [Carex littledalei]